MLRVKIFSILLSFVSIFSLFFIHASIAQFGDPSPRDLMGIEVGPTVVATGELFHSQTDLAIPGRELSFNFTRTYKYGMYLDYPTKSLGDNWTHSYNWYIFPNGNYLEVYTGSGGVDKFQVGYGGNFTPEPGVRATLEWAGDVLVYTTKHGVKYKFSHFNHWPPTDFYRLTNIESPNGNSLTLHYTVDYPQGYPQSRIKAIVDTVGRVAKFSYKYYADYYPCYFVSKLEFGIGTPDYLTTVLYTVDYVYDGCYLTEVHYQLGSGDPRGTELVTRYEYEYPGLLKKVFDPRGNIIQYTYNYYGQISQIQKVGAGGSPSVTLRSFSYTDISTTASTAGKNEVTYYPNANGDIDTAENGIDTEYAVLQWDNYRNREQIEIKKTPYNYQFKRDEFEYQTDSDKQMGNVTRHIEYGYQNGYSELRRVELDYNDTYNKVTWQKDPMNHQTTCTYDSNGNLIEAREKAGTGSQDYAIGHDIVVTHEYDSYGNIVRTIDPKKTTEFFYDSTYHAYPVETKIGNISTYQTWDVDRGLLLSATDANGRTTEYGYYKDRLLKYERRLSDNSYIEHIYDKNGNNIQTIVRDGQGGTILGKVETEYDILNRVVKAKEYNNYDYASGNNPSGVGSSPYAITECTYDECGNLKIQTDARGLVTTYDYDVISRPTKVTHPNGDYVETRYYEVWNWGSLEVAVKTWTSEKGSEYNPAALYKYDKLHRLTEAHHITGEYVNYYYDKNGNRTSVSCYDTGRIDYKYDELNRLRHRAHYGSRDIFHEYDDVGNMLVLWSKPQGGMSDYYVTYQYDSLNRITSVYDSKASNSTFYTYYDGGQLKRISYHHCMYTDYTIDAENRISQITHRHSGNVFVDLHYEYDKLDNVTSLLRDDTGVGGQSKYHYFYYDDLNQLAKVEYDKFGSLETVRYSYDVLGNRTQLYSSLQGTTAYSYAANANQLTYRSQALEDPDFSDLTYEYDLEGNLQRRRNATTTNYDDFIYDAFASQLSQVKKYRNGGLSGTVEYSYDSEGNRTKIVDSSGTKSFVYDGDLMLMGAGWYYVYGPEGVIYKKDMSSGSYEYHHKNALGSVVLLTGGDHPTPTFVARYEYDAFGSIRTQDGASDNTHKFTGKEYDDDVKLYYYGARYYDAYIGRFISRDPAGDGMNLYAYCLNNPLRYVDPDGLATYNRREAVRYAKKNWKKYNKKYTLRKGLSRIFGGTPPDCTNFISQCLHAGGIGMTGDWYFIPGGYDFWGRHTGHSRTWTVARDFSEWLRDSGWVAKETSYTLKKEDISTIAATASYGDLIALVNTEGRLYHWTIITKITGKFSPKGKVYITYHTTDRLNKDLGELIGIKIIVFCIKDYKPEYKGNPTGPRTN